ncbi:discoidin domain-containing protein [Winogradskyella thalassocola]|uniref:Por secretion system C-terminal sorting domain-containing protein n=1 Tax=Winogradskyella thalassocola TaxID=262004 RepID=A0A1G8H9R5_9FLAO|nr:discoidin domain-containing protein [Winogradskyella thalassocola]SDI03241.1 Por secretion system C-terminal sorting domain-containing protein [Winogradskyella thalassocola]
MINLKYSKFFFLFLIIGFKGFSQNPEINGQWSNPIPFDIVPVALANLPDGKLITWSSKYHHDFGGDDGYTFTQIFDPSIGTDGAVFPRTRTNTNHDMFCPGINNLADGRIMATGGSSSERASIYDPKTETWSRADDMNIARGYQGAVTLADGSAFTIGGSWSGGAYGGRTAEIWTEDSGWTVLNGLQGELLWNAADSSGETEGQFRLDNHAWLWAAPNGKIFHAGPGERMHWLDVNGDNGNGSYVDAGQRGDDEYSMNGNTVMYDIGKILKVGGSETYASNTLSNEKAYVININDENNVTVTRTTNDMAHARIFVSSVALPNGEVLVLGGMNTAVAFSDVGAHLSAEMFNPATNSFRTLASMQIPRTYHSAGILLNDGRVFIGGGGLCGNCPTGGANHPNAEIYSPPYLFDDNGDLAIRPTLNSPDNAYYGVTLPVTASLDVTEFSFVRMSSSTHSVNNEQRRIPVAYTGTNGNYQLAMPNANILPPGYYMLFALNADGVPSMSEAVLVGSPDSRIKGANLLVEFDFFEGNGSDITDTSGNDNNGVIKEYNDSGADVPLSAGYWNQNGFSGSSLQMDGMEFNSNTIVEIPSSPSLAALTDQITVMAWVNRDTGSIIPENGEIPNVSIFAHDYASFFFGYHNSLYKLEFFTETNGQASCYTGEYNPGVWEHLVGTYDGTIARLYVNGQQICSDIVSGNLQINTTDPLYDTFTLSGFYDKRPAPVVGYGNSSGVTDELDGSMDKFKLYNVALSPEEIQSIYDSERGVVVGDNSCENLEIVYDINGDIDSGFSEISVNVGDDVGLFLNSESIDYTLRAPDGSIINSNVLDDITLAQSGLYSINSTLSKSLIFPVDPILVSVDSEEIVTEAAGALNALDNNPATFWHTEWAPPGDDNDPDYPHEIVLDLGENSGSYGLTYLPRQTGVNGRIGDFEIYVSNSISEWGTPVATGTGGNNTTLQTVTFPSTEARYLRFLALTPAIAGQNWASAAEITVIKPVPSVIYVNSEELTSTQSGSSANAIDGDPSTIWHTEWNQTTTAYPHEIQIDLGEESSVMGLEYLPRQGVTLNGTIANYEIYVSNSTSNWGSSVASGTWAYNNTLKTVNFTEKQGRYIRLRALTEGGGNAWASAAEIMALTPSNQCIKTIQINVENPITYTYSNGWFPSDPNGLATSIDTIIINEGDAVISSNTSCKDLIVEAGMSLTVNTGITLTANTTTLNSISQEYSSLIVEGVVDGEVSYKRYVNKIGTSVSGGNDLISSPVENAAFNNDFEKANLNLPQNPNNFGEFAFAPYNVAEGAYQNFNIGAYRTEEFPLTSGTGYRAATLDGGTLTFKGTVGNNNISNVPITDASAGFAWNLIGNPYPSYLDFNEFFTANANEFESNGAFLAVYGYDGNASDGWTVWNYATIADPNIAELIAPGQGFFVKAQSGGGLVNYTTAMRRKGSSDDFILGRSSTSNFVSNKLNLTSDNHSSSTQIYFIEGTTRGLDVGFDAGSYKGSATDFSIFSNLVESNTGIDIAIQSLPYTDINDVVIPIGVNSEAGVQLSIGIEDISSLPANIKIYLEDALENTFTLLNNADYVFSPVTDLNGTGRFYIHYSNSVLSLKDSELNNLQIFTTANPKLLNIKGKLNAASMVNLYDIQGRLVLNKKINQFNLLNTINISNIGTGVYIVKVFNDSQIKTQKLVIK